MGIELAILWFLNCVVCFALGANLGYDMRKRYYK
jgi:hypothetical protein